MTAVHGAQPAPSPGLRHMLGTVATSSTGGGQPNAHHGARSPRCTLTGHPSALCRCPALLLGGLPCAKLQISCLPCLLVGSARRHCPNSPAPALSWLLQPSRPTAGVDQGPETPHVPMECPAWAQCHRDKEVAGSRFGAQRCCGVLR